MATVTDATVIDYDELFGDDGPLAQSLPGFRARAEQQALAAAIGERLQSAGSLLAEAGTGTGKTFAYLAPAMLSGRKVIVSTGTKALQDQLYQKDIPAVGRALGKKVRTAVLKGRANYFCHHRAQVWLEEGRFESRAQIAELHTLLEWGRYTKTGDLAEAPPGANDARLRPKITSTTENCLGGECPAYQDCFVVEARRKAQEADLVVVNHHLLLADWAVKGGGFGEVLPNADVYILDEAHQLPEIAANFLGHSFTSRQLHLFIQDARMEYQREAGDLPAFPDALDRLDYASRDLRLELGAAGVREAWPEPEHGAAFTAAVEKVAESLAEVREHLGVLEGRGPGLDTCLARCEMLSEALKLFLKAVDDAASVRWYETFQQGYALNETPLDVSDAFRKRMNDGQTQWILTSATLTVNKTFDHFARQLGMSDYQSIRLESPFDFEHNARLYVPAVMQAPNQPGYQEKFLRMTRAVLEYSRGRAFVLFTSHRALREAADWLRDQIDYPLLVQGDATPHQLLEQFRQAGDAVLLGTASFWEGVDVRGEALSCVIIDRLPFASPGDPVVKARIRALENNGLNPFAHYQIPRAVIALRQGVGRLIRDVDDRGVLVIGDIRIITHRYGGQFLGSLPPMPLIRRLKEVEAFFDGEADEDAAEPLVSDQS